MPKTPALTINLVPRDPFFSTPIGKVLQWALSVGRYIVIFTELIVILSFLTRFNLDRQVTDLNEAIFQKKTIIESYGSLESDVRLTQQKIDHYLEIEQQSNLVEVFPLLTQVTPQEIRLENLNIKPGSISLSGQALTQESLNLFANNLQLSPAFTNISINKIESEDEDKEGQGFKFNLEATVTSE